MKSHLLSAYDVAIFAGEHPSWARLFAVWCVEQQKSKWWRGLEPWPDVDLPGVIYREVRYGGPYRRPLTWSFYQHQEAPAWESYFWATVGAERYVVDHLIAEEAPQHGLIVDVELGILADYLEERCGVPTLVNLLRSVG